MWSFVGAKARARWLWHAIDHHTGRVLASVVGTRKDAMFLKLKALRRRLADAKGIPAYLVFSDASLLLMAARRPATDDEFLDISGVGPTKLAMYGALFLEALREGC